MPISLKIKIDFFFFSFSGANYLRKSMPTLKIQMTQEQTIAKQKEEIEYLEDRRERLCNSLHYMDARLDRQREIIKEKEEVIRRQNELIQLKEQKESAYDENMRLLMEIIDQQKKTILTLQPPKYEDTDTSDTNTDDTTESEDEREFIAELERQGDPTDPLPEYSTDDEAPLLSESSSSISISDTESESDDDDDWHPLYSSPRRFFQ